MPQRFSVKKSVKRQVWKKQTAYQAGVQGFLVEHLNSSNDGPVAHDRR